MAAQSPQTFVATAYTCSTTQDGPDKCWSVNPGNAPPDNAGGHRQVVLKRGSQQELVCYKAVSTLSFSSTAAWRKQDTFYWRQRLFGGVRYGKNYEK